MARLFLATASLAFALTACQREAAAEPPTTKPPTPATKEAPTKAEPATAQSYVVRIVAGEAKAGASTTSVVEVTPAEGYKINLEFPSRLQLSPTAGVKPAKERLGKEDAEVSEKMLRFNVAFTPASAGHLKMNCTADFSVCNDSTCKLIRDEKLAWEVHVK